jgi:hypothetical protein
LTVFSPMIYSPGWDDPTSTRQQNRRVGKAAQQRAHAVFADAAILRVHGIPMIVIAMITEANNHPAAIRSPPKAIQRTFRSKASRGLLCRRKAGPCRVGKAAQQRAHAVFLSRPRPASIGHETRGWRNDAGSSSAFGPASGFMIEIRDAFSVSKAHR